MCTHVTLHIHFSPPTTTTISDYTNNTMFLFYAFTFPSRRSLVFGEMSTLKYAWLASDPCPNNRLVVFEVGSTKTVGDL